MQSYYWKTKKRNQSATWRPPPKKMGRRNKTLVSGGGFILYNLVRGGGSGVGWWGLYGWRTLFLENNLRFNSVCVSKVKSPGRFHYSSHIPPSNDKPPKLYYFLGSFSSQECFR